MRLLEESFDSSGNAYYMEKQTSSGRDNSGFVLPNDAVLMRIGVNVGKYKHHIEIAQMIIEEQRNEYKNKK